jgi:D-alanyl-D-alanine carboxypeptidase/D-alanyl-D-alanine-endopeptidase (penicillin-binding protein 4)
MAVVYNAIRFRSCRMQLVVTVLLLTSVCLDSYVLAQQPSPTLQDRINRLLSQPKWESGFWGIHIISLKNREILFSSNARKRFIPASTVKLLVGAAALERLGPDFRFETPVFAEGPIDTQGRLLGNLVLVGRGDPNLEGRRYDPEQEDLAASDVPPFVGKIVDEVTGRGVRLIVGDIVADETYFLHEPFAPTWTLEDLPWNYGAPASALAVNENLFKLEVLPGETAGSPALMRTYPVETGIEAVNKVRTVSQGKPPSMGMERSLDGKTYTFQGEIPVKHPGLKYNLSVVDPAQFAAQLLKSALAQRGVVVTGKAKSRQMKLLDVLQDGKLSLDKARQLQTPYPEDRRLALITTLPLFETLKILMKASQNLYAEMLLRVLGARASAGVGCLETGISVLEEFSSGTGTAKGTLALFDGSGLSRKNLVTPESVVQLLDYMDQHPLGERFRDLLPVAGREGTLKDRMSKSLAAERVVAKTGTIEFVAALSGYASTRDGERLAFSIMVNHERAGSREVREVIDEICAWMIEYDSTGESSLGTARN